MGLKKGTVKVGDTEISVYLMPDGAYAWSMAQASLLIGYHRSWLSETVRRDTGILEKLNTFGFKNEEIQKFEIGCFNFKLISTFSFMAMIMYGAQEGKPEAIALLVASMQETLERRADHAFGVVRNEKEYQEKFSARYAAIALNKNIRAAMTTWMDKQGEEKLDLYFKEHGVSTRGGLFGKTIGTIYKILFGRTKSQVNKHLGVENKSLTPRDTLEYLQLQSIVQIERMSAKLIDTYKVDPISSIQIAAERLMIEKEEPRLGEYVSLRDANKKHILEMAKLVKPLCEEHT